MCSTPPGSYQCAARRESLCKCYGGVPGVGPDLQYPPRSYHHGQHLEELRIETTSCIEFAVTLTYNMLGLNRYDTEAHHTRCLSLFTRSFGHGEPRHVDYNYITENACARKVRGKKRLKRSDIQSMKPMSRCCFVSFAIWSSPADG